MAFVRTAHPLRHARRGGGVAHVNEPERLRGWLDGRRFGVVARDNSIRGRGGRQSRSISVAVSERADGSVGWEVWVFAHDGATERVEMTRSAGPLADNLDAAYQHAHMFGTGDPNRRLTATRVRDALRLRA